MIKVSEYYIIEVIFLINSIPENIMKMIIGALLAIPLAVIIKEHSAFKEINT